MAEGRRDSGGHSHKERANGSERDRKRGREERDGEARPPPEHRIHHDAACVQSRDLAFGINYAASGGPEDRCALLMPSQPPPLIGAAAKNIGRPGLSALW